MVLDATAARWAFLWKQIPGLLMLIFIGWMFVLVKAPDQTLWAVIGTGVIVAFGIAQLLVRPDHTRITVSSGAVSWTERTWTGTDSTSCAPRDFRIGEIVVPSGKHASMPTWLLLHFGDTEVGALAGWEKSQLEPVVRLLESWTNIPSASLRAD
jgi:hypothetical protein